MDMSTTPLDDSLPVLNRPDALDRLGGDEAMLDEFLDLLWEQTVGDLPKFAQAIKEGDSEDLQRIGHSLKGAAASLSAERVREAAGRLETAGRNGDLSQAMADFEILNSEVEALRSTLGK